MTCWYDDVSAQLYLLSSSEEGHLQVGQVSLSNVKLHSVVPHAHQASVRCGAHINGKGLLTGSEDGVVSTWVPNEDAPSAKKMRA